MSANELKAIREIAPFNTVHGDTCFSRSSSCPPHSRFACYFVAPEISLGTSVGASSYYSVVGIHRLRGSDAGRAGQLATSVLLRYVGERELMTGHSRLNYSNKLLSQVWC